MSANLVDAVVEAWRREGLAGDPEDLRRYAELAVEVCERDTVRLREALRRIADGRWNVGTDRYLSSRQFAREALAENGEPDG